MKDILGKLIKKKHGTVYLEILWEIPKESAGEILQYIPERTFAAIPKGIPKGFCC